MREAPILTRTRAELAAARETARTARGPVAVVMTMGALHAGHAALIRAARERAATVIVTIFVNPLQFGPTEDFAVYPRPIEDDLAMCAREGVDVVFAPAVGDVYRAGEPLVRLAPGPAGALLEGASRPGFFDGVLTVVAKMLHLTAPDLALFGHKDAQQLAVVRRMVADLDFPVEIVGVPTVREEDGLALSSRNRYLSPAERTTALALSQALAAGTLKAADGADAVRASAEAVLADAATADPPLATDYLALVHPDTFTAVGPDHTGPAVLAVAARVGATRLIDNTRLVLGGVR